MHAELVAFAADRINLLQFVYKAKRGVSDATLTVLNLIHTHFDMPGTFVKVLCKDFCSAFNTIQPHVLFSRQLDLDVSTTIVLEYGHSYATGHGRSMLRDIVQTE